jgi:hypothetical protein
LKFLIRLTESQRQLPLAFFSSSSCGVLGNSCSLAKEFAGKEKNTTFVSSNKLL